MTGRGKFVVTVLILAVVGFGMYRWWDKIAPTGKPQTPSLDPKAIKQALDAAKPKPDDASIMSKLLAGTNADSLIGESAIPPGSEGSDYDKTMKAGKLVVEILINGWPGSAPSYS